MVACACGVDKVRDEFGRNFVAVMLIDDEGAFLGPRDKGEGVGEFQVIDHVIERVRVVERQRLGFVGKEDVSLLLGELAKRCAVALDAERVR